MREVAIKGVYKFKENLAPRPEGLNISQLVGRPSSLAADFDNADTDDPLYPYLRQIDHTRAQNKELRMTPELVQEIANCIEVFKDHERYKNDIRFVKLCLEYGSFSESPSAMFAFMEFHELGAECSIFWYRWAKYLETVHLQSVEAKKVLSRGLLHNAEPQQLLLKAIKEISERAEKKKVAAPARPHQNAPKRKLMVYEDVESGEDEEPSSPPAKQRPAPHEIKVPQIVHEKKENRQHAEPLVITSRGTRVTSQRRLHVYMDADEQIERPDSKLLYNELLLRHRTFRAPLRPFEPRQLRMMDKQVIAHTGLLRLGLDKPEACSLKDAIFEQHMGQTEVIGHAVLDRKGDTELLN